MRSISHYLLLVIMLLNSVGARSQESIDGILMLSDKYEQDLRTSSSLVKDPQLNSHVRELMCALAGERCTEVRAYIFRKPGFNAFMLPNGAMFVQTGLLLRVKSDDELSVVIAHELAHFFEKHGVEKAATRKVVEQGTNVLNIGMQLSGMGILQSSLFSGAASHLILSAYSREAESEADAVGLSLMVEASVNPDAAQSLWRRIAEEKEISADNTISFLSTHPSITSRQAAIKSLLTEINAEEEDAKYLKSNTHLLRLLSESRLDFLNDELDTVSAGHFEHLLTTQTNLVEIEIDTVSNLCSEAWLRSAKAQTKDTPLWLSDMRKAVNCYSGTDNNSLGLSARSYKKWAGLSEQLGNQCQALTNYQRYLELDPNAWDSLLVQKKIDGLMCHALTD